MDEPLIYTSKGNLPVSSLQYSHEWLEDEQAITFAEQYTLNGEVVRRNVHQRMKRGLDSALQQAVFG